MQQLELDSMVQLLKYTRMAYQNNKNAKASRLFVYDRVGKCIRDTYNEDDVDNSYNKECLIKDVEPHLRFILPVKGITFKKDVEDLLIVKSTKSLVIIENLYKFFDKYI